MGKKKVTKQTTEEAISEKENLEAAYEKSAGKATAANRFEHGRVYINCSYNNTLISITNDKGGVVAWSSAGSFGFNGPKKATPFAASKIVAALSEKIRKSGPFNVDVFVNGIGGGRDSAVRSLAMRGFNILSIHDITPIPHNGPRPPKVRRV